MISEINKDFNLMAPTIQATQGLFKARQSSTNHSHDDYGPRLNIAIWLFTGVAAIFLGLRLYCKRIRQTKLWWDDHILIVAFV